MRASLTEVDLPCPWMGHHFCARAFHHHLAEVEHADALGEVEGGVHVVLDHYDGHVARDAGHEGPKVPTLFDGESGERLVEEQDSRALGEGQGDLHAPSLAVGGLGEGPIRETIE